MLGKFKGRRVSRASGKEMELILDDYLGYLRSEASIEPVEDGTHCLTLPFWSLPATKDAAATGGDDLVPWSRLYVILKDDGWEISDRGENLGVLTELGFESDAVLHDFRKLLSYGSLSLRPDNSMFVSSDSGMTLGKAIHKLVEVVSIADGLFSDDVWQTFGKSSSRNVFDLAGIRMNFAGGQAPSNMTVDKESSDTHSDEAMKVWVSTSFQLSRGALVVSFQSGGTGEAEIELVRDKAGIFDSPKPLFELDGKGAAIGLWRVAAGGWQDPHPGRSYHLKVAAPGDFECTMLQPELGQVAVNFPYSTGGVGGATLAGPFRVGSRPIRANLRHDGGANFFVELVSLDGSDKYEVIDTDGQVHLDEYPVEIKPGKEYLLYAMAGGHWELQLIEGY